MKNIQSWKKFKTNEGRIYKKILTERQKKRF